jgi:hypothetical protein
MTDFSYTKVPGSAIWNRLSTLLAWRSAKPGKGPRNPRLFVDREMSRLPPHLLRDIGMFDGWPD